MTVSHPGRKRRHYAPNTDSFSDDYNCHCCFSSVSVAGVPENYNMVLGRRLGMCLKIISLFHMGYYLTSQFTLYYSEIL